MRHDREYWLVAGGFALFFGSPALVEPYLVKHLLALGFTGSQVGTLMAVVSLVGMVLVPLASSRVDHSGHHRRWVRIAAVSHAASTTAMGVLGAPILVAACVIPYRYFVSLGMTIRNRLTLYWLEQRHSQDFGGLRLWGSIGYSLFVFGGGLLAERTGIPFLFVVSGGLIVLSLPLLRPFAKQLPTAPPRTRQGRLPAALWIILLVTGLTAFSRTAYNGWAQDFLAGDLNGGDSAVGLYMALIALVEVPVMYYAHHLIDRWGATALWVVGLVLLGSGFGLLALASSVGGALIGTVPIGVAQGLTILAPVVLTGQVSRPHNVTLNLALAGVLGSLGTMLGSPIAGWLFDQIGARSLFVVGAAGMVLTAVILAVGSYAVQRMTGQQPAAE